MMIMMMMMMMMRRRRRRRRRRSRRSRRSRRRWRRRRSRRRRKRATTTTTTHGRRRRQNDDDDNAAAVDNLLHSLGKECACWSLAAAAGSAARSDVSHRCLCNQRNSTQGRCTTITLHVYHGNFTHIDQKQILLSFMHKEIQ